MVKTILSFESPEIFLSKAFAHLDFLGIKNGGTIETFKMLSYFISLYGYGKSIGGKIKTAKKVSGCIKEAVGGDTENVDEGHYLQLAILCGEKYPQVFENIAEELNIDVEKMKNIYYAGVYLARYIMYVDTDFYRTCEEIADGFCKRYDGFDPCDIDFASKVDLIERTIDKDVELYEIFRKYNKRRSERCSKA